MDEAARLASLRELDLLDTCPEAEFDDLVRLASAICNAPISLISLVDDNRQWFKAAIGLEIRETPREGSFCDHAIDQASFFSVEDAREDPRFKNNWLVTPVDGIRFYAGVTLEAPNGAAIGTLCVIDMVPRKLTEVQKEGLKILADQVQARIEMRSERRALERALAENQRLCKRVQSALKEKDVLLGEIHHRVKNNLQIIYSLLDLQRGQVEDPAVLSTLTDLQNRVRSMALIHQTLYQSNDFSEVDFGAFLRLLAPTLIESYLEHPERIALSIKVEDMHLPIDVAIPCGLLVNELVSNCLKHAFPHERRGQIEIEVVRAADDNFVLTVRDNGVGMAAGFELTATASLGLQLVFLLSDQLGGTMIVRRSDPTSFTLRFGIKSRTAAAA